MSLVAVMLYDFQDRKFLPRERQGYEEFVQEVRDVEICLLRWRKKNSKWEKDNNKNKAEAEQIEEWRRKNFEREEIIEEVKVFLCVCVCCM